MAPKHCLALIFFRCINYLMHFGRPLARFGTLLVSFWFQLTPFCKISNDSSPPDSARFGQYLAKNCCPQTASIQRCRRSPRRYNGPINCQLMPKSLSKNSPALLILRSRKTLKHCKTPSGLNRRSFGVFHCFAFSNFNVKLSKNT